MKVLFSVLVLLVNFVGLTISKGSNIITLSNGGKIQGRKLKSYENKVYTAYQQIPYAAPPIGDLRFKEPTEAKTWSDVLNTTANTKICIQLTVDDPRETEDCLYLNVYVPECFFNNNLPVYVYFHGGVFYKGDGTFDSFGPQFLMDYNIILVTVNYRLGAFGFISTEDEVLPGNLGLKDQKFALEWIQNNINVFGGDPKKVTIGGQSAGAGAVSYHLLNLQSKGLFRAAIQESGSALDSKMFMKHPKYFAFQLGKSLNNSFSDKNSSQELLNLLLNTSAQKIKAHSNLEIPENMRNAVGNVGNTLWNPVEEHGENAFVTGLMHEKFKKGEFIRVPILIGFNSEEELHFDLDSLKSKAKYFDDNPSLLVNGNLNIKEENKLPAGEKIKKVYTNKTFQDDFPAFIRFVSDIKYTTGIIRQADLQQSYTDVFLYQFAYEGSLGGIHQSVPGIRGVGHTDELNYLFLNEENKNIDSYPKKDLKVQKTVLKLWTNFVKNSNPLNHFDLDFMFSKWPKVSSNSIVYQNISDELKLAVNPRNYAAIRDIYNEYAEKIQYTY